MLLFYGEQMRDYTASRSTWFWLSSRGRIAEIFGKRVSFWCFARNIIVFDVWLPSQMGWQRTADERQIMECCCSDVKRNHDLMCAEIHSSVLLTARFIKQPLCVYEMQTQNSLSLHQFALWKRMFTLLWWFCDWFICFHQKRWE